MDNRDSITHYAVLIGIDDYPDQPLKSAASDAREARKLLESKLDKDRVKIFSLVADLDDKAPVQYPVLRPTRQNFFSVFDTITKDAKPDSFVYIHFSGHGTKKIPEEEFADVALVLLDEDTSTGGAYLWGEELADAVRILVDKNLVVTVVLDSCFSGGVYRRERESRYLPYDTKMDIQETRIRSSTESAQSHSPFRDISSLPNWLANPKGYAVITACSSAEETDGAKFEGQWSGILSYFLFDTLKWIGLERSLKTVHDRLRAKIGGSAFGRNQNPLLYGDKDQAFFGPLEWNSNSVDIPVILRKVNKTSKVELQAGQAHGMSVGDRFTMFPAEGKSKPDQPPLTARIVQCNNLTSILEVSDSSVRTGWFARLQGQLRLQEFPVRLAPSISDRQAWLSEMGKRTLRACSDVKDTPTFELVLDSNQQYQILDENGAKLANLPTMPQDQVAVDEVCDVLKHLIRFRLASGLTNKTSAADSLSKVDISIRHAGKSYGPTDNLAMKHNTKAEIVVKNRGDKPVCVFIYNHGSDWQIEQVFRGSYYLVSPNGTQRKTIRKTVPESITNQGHETCMDMVKVIVTSRSASFDILEMPQLGGLAKRRSGEENRDAITGPENWIAVNFPIRTFMEEHKDSITTVDVD